MTLSQFALDWRLQNLSDRTISEYLRVLRKVELSHRLPLDLGTARQLVADERDRGVKSSTVVFFVRAIKAYHAWWAEEHEQPDPLDKLKFPKQEQSPPGKIVTDEEIERLLQAFAGRGFENLRNRSIVRVLIDTGMRRSEIAALRFDDVDLERENPHLVLRKTKNRDSRVVPLTRTTAMRLRRYVRERATHPMAECPEFFIGRKGPLRADSISAVLGVASQRAGISVSSHQFRRRFSSNWIRNGGSDDTLMALAGWKTLTMPARYREAARVEHAFEQYRRINGEGSGAQARISEVGDGGRSSVARTANSVRYVSPSQRR